MECSSAEGGRMKKTLTNGSGEIDIRLWNGTYNDCIWEFNTSGYQYDVLLVNVKDMKLDCEDGYLEISGVRYCDKSTPFCVAFSRKPCHSTLSFEKCEMQQVDNFPLMALNATTSTSNQGVAVNYAYHGCHKMRPTVMTRTHFVEDGVPWPEEFHPHPEQEGNEPSPNLVGILVPVSIFVLIILLMTALFVVLRRRSRAQKYSSQSFQQYVTTVTTDNNQMADAPTGSSLTLEFGRSYETVPRGTNLDSTVPIYSVLPDKRRYSGNSSSELTTHESLSRHTRDGAIRLSGSSFNFSQSNAVTQGEFSNKARTNLTFVLDSD